MTQRMRVLRSLQAAGPFGITQADWLGNTPDGGGSITRLAARVEELRSDGYVIESGERRHKCTVYRLRREPVQRIIEPTEREVRLFAPPPQSAIGEAA